MRHPLAKDADASERKLAEAQAECALALGRLDGLLASLVTDETPLFCITLVRETLLSALAQAGFMDAQLRFDHWFAGLTRGPEETSLTSYSAHAVVRAILGELGRHSWEPLAQAAQMIAKSARFVTDRPAGQEDQLAADAISAAVSLVARADVGGESALPFADLSRLGDLLRQDPMFAPVEGGTSVLSLAGRDVPIERSASRTPLWAVDALLGNLLAAKGICRRPLPFPGAVSAEGMRAHLWPKERSILEAQALAASTKRLTELIVKSKGQVVGMRKRLGHLRSSARAPQVWTLLAGFAPMGVDQLVAAFGLSRRGTYAVSDALVSAGLARRTKIKGKVLLVVETPVAELGSSLPDQSATLPSSALAEFNTALAELDRLLERSSHSNGSGDT